MKDGWDATRSARKIILGVYRGRGIGYHVIRAITDRGYLGVCAHSAREYLLARIYKKKLVHFIGDSHVMAFAHYPGFVAHHVGRATAHNLIDLESSTDSRKILFKYLSGIDLKRDKVVTEFGEIDCRIHFYYQYMKNKKRISMPSLMDRTIARYGSVLDEMRRMGADVYVCSVPPAARQGNVFSYPFYAPPRTRARISREFNRKLAQFCKKKGYVFLDIYSKVADSGGFIMKEYAADSSHLNSLVAPMAKELLP